MSTEMTSDRNFDAIVIGAGLYGIQAARTYLEIHPEAKLILFDSASTIGGTWSSERMYDAFQTQTPLRLAEWSDQPMHHINEKECYFDFFPAHHVTTYLEDYVSKHIYKGEPLRNRFRMQSPVKKVFKKDFLWHVMLFEDDTPYRAPKLMDASGLTSLPNIPVIPGREHFKGRVIHHKQFGQSDILTNETLKNIVVLGGAKSAADVAYAAAKAGKSVKWVIRRNGSGPCTFVSAQGPGPYRNSNDSTYTRLMGSMMASVFTTPSVWSSFIHSTGLGQLLFDRVWAGSTQGALDLADFDRADGYDNGYRNLKPDTPVFWQNDSTGVNQRADFFDIIAHRVHVYREDVDKLDSDSLILADGTVLPCDALLLATGWKSTSDLYDNDLAKSLGLPVRKDLDQGHAETWQILDKQGEAEAVKRFPVFQKPPKFFDHVPQLTPFRLYKTIVPISDPSIMFLGKTMLGNNFRNAEAQALWATAVLDGTFQLPSEADQKLDVARTLGWCRKRYLAKGALGHWFYFDVVPYTDMLLQQLGLSSHRKSFLKDFFAPCLASDLQHSIPEYLRKVKSSDLNEKS